MRYFILLLSSACLIGCVYALGKVQSIGVKGKLMCDNKPYDNVKVKLYEVDFADPDDLLSEGRTNKTGQFQLVGTQEEIGQIEPKLNIYHNCQDEQKECLRKVEILIDSNFIVDGKNATKIFDIGTLNLNGIFPGESRDCLN